MGSEKSWLECIPWNGNEQALPMNMTICVPGISIENLIKSGTSGLDIKIDEERFEKIVGAYGRECIRIIDMTGKHLDRWEWREKYGTDGLLLYAMRKIR